MKKILLTIIAALGALTLSAQNSADILSKIEKAGAKAEDIVTPFKESRTPADKTQPKVNLKGKLVFKSEGFLSMQYDNGDNFYINGDKMIITQNGVDAVYDTTKNLLMKSLNHTLMYAFRGEPSKIAEEQQADITAEKKGDDYVVTLTARKKSARGYSRVIVYYDSVKCIIKGMQMDEVTGASTVYSM